MTKNQKPAKHIPLTSLSGLRDEFASIHYRIVTLYRQIGAPIIDEALKHDQEFLDVTLFPQVFRPLNIISQSLVQKSDSLRSLRRNLHQGIFLQSPA